MEGEGFALAAGTIRRTVRARSAIREPKVSNRPQRENNDQEKENKQIYQ
jgi:hypothetical protein